MGLLVELGASRGARPVRRRLIGVILFWETTAGVVGQSRLPFRVIPMFYPMRFSLVRDEEGRQGKTSRVVRPFSFKRVEIPPRGFGPQPLCGNSGESPVRFVQPRPAWGVPSLVTGGTDSGPESGTFGKSEGHEELNHERRVTACR